MDREDQTTHNEVREQQQDNSSHHSNSTTSIATSGRGGGNHLGVVNRPPIGTDGTTTPRAPTDVGTAGISVVVGGRASSSPCE